MRPRIRVWMLQKYSYVPGWRNVKRKAKFRRTT